MAQKIKIVRWTTPTILYRFSETVPVASISKAYLVAKVRGVPMFELDIDDATVSQAENTVSWKLTQEDTGKLPYKQTGELFMDWYLSDGTRGEGVETTFETRDSGKNEVIE